MAEIEIKRIERMARRLGETQGSSVRRAARALLEGVPVCEPDIQACLAAVQSPTGARWEEYSLACWTLSRVDVAPRTRKWAAWPLCDIVDGYAPADWYDGSVNQCAVWTSVASVVAGLAAGASVFTNLAADISVNDNRVDRAIDTLAITLLTSLLAAVVSNLGLLALSMPLVAPIIVRARKAGAACSRAWAVRTLSRWNSVSSLGAVSRAVVSVEPELRTVATLALRSILAHVAETDYRSLRAQDQVSLADLLRSGLDVETKLSLLDALGHIGGGPVLKTVADFASASRDPALNERAALALPRIEQRARMERDSSILLRAAAKKEDPDSFVRPVNRPESDPQFLVRTAEAAPGTG